MTRFINLLDERLLKGFPGEIHRRDACRQAALQQLLHGRRNGVDQFDLWLLLSAVIAIAPLENVLGQYHRSAATQGRPQLKDGEVETN